MNKLYLILITLTFSIVCISNVNANWNNGGWDRGTNNWGNYGDSSAYENETDTGTCPPDCGRGDWGRNYRGNEGYGYTAPNFYAPPNKGTCPPYCGNGDLHSPNRGFQPYGSPHAPAAPPR